MAIIRLVNGECFNGNVVEDRGDVIIVEVCKKDHKTDNIRHVCIRTIPFQYILSIDYY